MNLSLLIYLAGVSDNVSILLYALIFVFAALTALGVVAWADNADCKPGNAQYPAFIRIKKLTKIFFVFLCFLVIGKAFIPSKSTIIAMYLIPKIAANKDMKNIPDNAAKALNVALKKYIDNIGSEK